MSFASDLEWARRTVRALVRKLVSLLENGIKLALISGCLIAQHGPVDTRAQFFAAHAGLALDGRAMLGRNAAARAPIADRCLDDADARG